MKQIIYLLLSLTCFQPFVHAVDNLRFADVRSLGIGGNEVTQSSLFNPSLIALQGKKQLQINYFNHYFLKELGTMHAGFQYPNSILPVGIDLFSFGYDAYRESMFRLSAGKRLGEKWVVGLSFQYAILQTELTEGAVSRLSTDLGALFRPVDNLLVGMLIMNLPSVSVLNKSFEVKDFISYLVEMGFQWEIINNLLIAGSIGTNQEENITGNIGVEYTVWDRFHIRAGIKGTPLLPSLGVGCDLSHFTINVAAVYHSVLGISTGVGLSYTF